ncbi:MAG: hypothetical protein IT370_14365 [Deltaproteobacteria bacterium]|nr:hypothetical protein [Deltaproteobacteria bacterium]
MTDTAFIADRIVWQFRRSGADGQQLRVFSAHPPGVQAQIGTMVGLGESEVPALAYFVDSADWVLLTTDRLARSENGQISSIPRGRIVDASVDAASLRQAGALGKEGLRTLVVTTVDGASSRIVLEAGRPFVGFWNALKMLAAENVRLRRGAV